jgi:hypothetical protein
MGRDGRTNGTMIGFTEGRNGLFGHRPQRAAIAALRRHWHGLRQIDSLPRRDQIAPKALAPILHNLLIAERRQDGAVLLRYAGMTVRSVHGEDLAGRPLSVLFETGTRIQLLEALDLAFAGIQTLDMHLYSERGLLRPPLTAQMTLLPLSEPGSDSHSLIGCLVLDGPPVLPPRRFRIERLLGEPLRPLLPLSAPAGEEGAAPPRALPAPILVWSGP